MTLTATRPTTFASDTGLPPLELLVNLRDRAPLLGLLLRRLLLRLWPWKGRNLGGFALAPLAGRPSVLVNRVK